jgi:hypothetical protein
MDFRWRKIALLSQSFLLFLYFALPVAAAPVLWELDGKIDPYFGGPQWSATGSFVVNVCGHFCTMSNVSLTVKNESGVDLWSFESRASFFPFDEPEFFSGFIFTEPGGNEGLALPRLETIDLAVPGIINLPDSGFGLDGLALEGCGGPECNGEGLWDGFWASGSTLTGTATVPLPPAVWLFGTALGFLGWIRRKAA